MIKLKFTSVYFVALIVILQLSACSEGSSDNNAGIPAIPTLCDQQQYPATATSLYVLPFKIGNSYRVSQANCTSHTHNAEFSLEFAYDFVMNIGTEIVAARSGTVAGLREDVANGTLGFDNINFLRVDHGDGTMGMYLHIAQDGALLSVGDTVLQGQLIALSGDTGTIGLAHLHFHVHEISNNSNGFQTLPVTFLNASPIEANELKEGITYMALSY